MYIVIKPLYERVPIEELEDHVEFGEMLTTFLSIPQLLGGCSLEERYAPSYTDACRTRQMDYVQLN